VGALAKRLLAVAKMETEIIKLYKQINYFLTIKEQIKTGSSNFGLIVA
jgi:hypothetical protein